MVACSVTAAKAGCLHITVDLELELECDMFFPVWKAFLHIDGAAVVSFGFVR